MLSWPPSSERKFPGDGAGEPRLGQARALGTVCPIDVAPLRNAPLILRHGDLTSLAFWSLAGHGGEPGLFVVIEMVATPSTEASFEALETIPIFILWNGPWKNLHRHLSLACSLLWLFPCVCLVFFPCGEPLPHSPHLRDGCPFPFPTVCDWRLLFEHFQGHVSCSCFLVNSDIKRSAGFWVRGLRRSCDPVCQRKKKIEPLTAHSSQPFVFASELTTHCLIPAIPAMPSSCCATVDCSSCFPSSC